MTETKIDLNLFTINLNIILYQIFPDDNYLFNELIWIKIYYLV
jgi:hypothetical protein